MLRGRLIEMLMCDFRIDSAEILDGYEITPAALMTIFQGAAEAFPGMVRVDSAGFDILPEGRPLTRMIARAFDAYDMREEGHSSAI